MSSYEDLRQQYRPQTIEWLFLAESPPPGAGAGGSRHFYRTDKMRLEDRLFLNTMRALYPKSTEGKPETDLEIHKEAWLRRFQADGCYMTEALEESQQHKVKKEIRQEKIGAALPRLIERLRILTTPQTKLFLIKSNVYEVASSPLQAAGFKVMNSHLIDYPGRFNQARYRERLTEALGRAGWPFPDVKI